MKNFKLIYATMVVTVLLIISALLNVGTLEALHTAHEAGRSDMYREIAPKIDNAIKALQAVAPAEQADGTLTPLRFNSKGEAHPQMKRSESLLDFVAKNCTPEVKDYAPDAIKYAKANGIKPEIIFAIAWADSQCGHALTTPYNYGNVGNTDGGKRQGFNSPIQGLNAITNTLNNGMIGGVDKVGHLSQGGRNTIGAVNDCRNAPAPYKCYATSVENWHNNVTGALLNIFKAPTSIIPPGLGARDRQIVDEWEFRT